MAKSKPIPSLTPEQTEYFWSRVDRSGGPDACWPWMGEQSARGYGRFRINGSAFQATRIALALTLGSLDVAQMACHRCDNPPCCNPGHLFPGTTLENKTDSVRKGRHARGDALGAAMDHRGTRNGRARLTEDQVREIRRRYQYRTVTVTALAAEYGVAFQTIHMIVSGQTWKHVEVT